LNTFWNYFPSWVPLPERRLPIMPPHPTPPHVPPQPEIPSGCGASTTSRSPPGRSSSSR
jgi:hypothetical protein